MEPDSSSVPRRTLTELLFVVFLRLIALSCLWYGLQYWAMLVGYSVNGQGRFDLLALSWKVAGTALAVLFPVAAVGLWLTVSWGPVVWVIAAGAQLMMYQIWPEVFGTNVLVPLTHILTATIYTAFRLALWLEKRHKDEQVMND